ncbi:HNH endonuclease (plasmid) [Psychrobacillus glaciei]|uniref:HNH endonuclease n=1 Tax=Psychrobacillus glaciei TaxID=2283160 RepID=A0A5J6SW51_9BACI|nr:HNH endonuclease [Psychrobacillus glaciei]QFG01295.1 HNH endonuclease [Psychrobacillus glaciei]
MEWMISANSKMYNFISAFDELSHVDWRQNANYQVGDIIYIYATKPYKRVMFKTEVKQVNLSPNEVIDDKKYWVNIDEYDKSLEGKYTRLKLLDYVNSEALTLERLREQGLKWAPQGPVKIRGEQLSQYLAINFNDYYSEGFFNDIDEDDIYEGHKRTVTVNKYERSSIARKNCVEKYGYNCAVCDMNFEDAYGDLGKSFIHVHHIVPLEQIGREYKVDYEKDLIPVCPNCHAMLHRKIDANYLSIAELKKKFNKR